MVETEFEYLKDWNEDKKSLHETPELVLFEVAHQLKRIADHLEWFTQFAERNE